MKKDNSGENEKRTLEEMHSRKRNENNQPCEHGKSS